MKIETIKIADIKPYAKNAKTHPKSQIELLAKIITEMGFRVPVSVDENNVLIAGHGRLEAAKKIGMSEVPAIRHSDLTPEQVKALRLADNKLTEMGGWDMDLVADELIQLNLEGFDINLTGFDENVIKAKEWNEVAKRNLQEDFIIPPFSVWDSKAGYWQERKRTWQDFYGDSREGRDDDLLGEGLKKLAQITGKKQRSGQHLSGTSEFDPVVAEICYRWFNVEKGRILDPFAGGSVRGVVAGTLGNLYTGIDLSKKQVETNREVAKTLGVENCEWIYGNSMNIPDLVQGEFDMVFSCPPYYDLEKYNDGEGDLSMYEQYHEFVADYRHIIRNAVSKLKENRFAVFVVGNIRDKEGFYRDFVTDTIKAFEDAGAKFYNDIILVNALATAPIRARRPFQSARKVVKVHQNVLAFFKGDPAEVEGWFKNLPKVDKYHENVVVFYKGDIEEIKKNYKIELVDTDL